MNDLLPGWVCQGCGGFNGEAKETLLVCRACGCKRRVMSLVLEHAAWRVMQAWNADGAGHALRCSPALVGAIVELEAVLKGNK